MKSGIPWNLKRVDEDTRQAVIDAARRANMSVGEWLNHVLAPEGQRYDEPLEVAPQRPAENVTETIDRLKARLEDLARGLAPAPAPQPRAQRSVAEMIAELAREIENHDERARTSVEGLRARAAASDKSGVVDAIRDLDRLIAGMGARAAPEPPQTGAERLDDIRSQLNALLARTPGNQPAAAPPAEPAARQVEKALEALESRIEAAKEQFADSPNEATRSHLERLEAQLGDIAARLQANEADRRKPELASAIREISAHQRNIDERAEVLAMRRDQKALSAAMAALRTDISALNDQVIAVGRNGAEEQGALFELARRIEALAADKPIDRTLLSDIRGEAERIRAIVESDATAAILRDVAARHEELAGQVNALMSATPNRRQVEALEVELAALREALEADDSPRALARIESRLVDLSQTVDSVLAAQAAGPDPILEQIEGRLGEIARRVDGIGDTTIQTAAVAAAQAQIEERLEDVARHLGGMIAGGPQVASIDALHRRIEDVVARIDAIGANSPDPGAMLDAMAGEIRALRAEIAARPPETAATEHLEAQIRDLAAQLGAVATSAVENPALARIEQQISAISGELEETRPRVAAVSAVEENLARVQALLADTTRQSIVGARAEAQQAVTQLSELVAQYEIDADLVRELMHDLDSLKTAAGATDEVNRAKLESVTRTVGEILDRVGRLERGGATAPLVQETAKAPTTGPETASEPLSERTLATEAGGERDLATPSAAERRADFIAAARRAAQEAARRVATDEFAPRAVAPKKDQPASPDAPSVAEVGPVEARPGAFARISRAIRARKRPLLLAAAAIVIAIGAMQIYDRLSTGKDQESLIAADGPTATVPVVPAETQFVAAEPGQGDAKLPTTPRVATAALVPPTAAPTASIAFGRPEAVVDRFQSTAATTAAQPAFEHAAQAPADAIIPYVEDASPTFAAAKALPPGYASGLDLRLGSERLLRAADDGDPAAAFEVARRYAEGTAVPKDLARAADWYRRAAEGGLAVAQYRLASLHERGQGVPKNLVTAANWYQRAADQGNVNAMHNLAVMMSEGVDGAPDHDKALQWFLAAANYGVRDSQYNLGVIYARGLGPEQDLAESYKWFAIAAALGDADAALRRDEVAKTMTPEELVQAQSAARSWQVRPTLAEANGVALPPGGWDDAGSGIADAERQELVRRIQVLLAEHGFDPGPPDGVVGPKTVEAVRAYQRTNGHPETGQIDNTLVAALATPRP